jgi:transcriptional regulator with XRE-family HTH domain
MPPEKSVKSARYHRLRELLVAARNDSGITQVELAKALGRGQSYVSKLERGDLEVGIDEFLTMTEFLGVDPLDILRQAMKT